MRIECNAMIHDKSDVWYLARPTRMYPVGRIQTWICRFICQIGVIQKNTQLMKQFNIHTTPINIYKLKKKPTENC